jgi:hypothetical protein
VASTCVESGGETLVLDPLAAPAEATQVWRRLDAKPPKVIVVLKPDHVRDVDVFVRRYGARAFGAKRSYSLSILAAAFSVALSRCMTDEVEMKPRCGCPNNAPWSSPTP